MITEGKIIIDLLRQGSERAGHVKIASNRSTDIGKLFQGKNPDEVVSLLPMIFSVCGVAHVNAAMKAFECSNIPLKDKKQGGEPVVLAENAREHLLRIMLSWDRDKQVQSEKIPLKNIMTFVGNMQNAAKAQDHEKITAIGQEISEYLERYVFSCLPKAWLELDTIAGLKQWTIQSDTVASRYLACIITQNWSSLGSVATAFLPVLPENELSSKMHGDNANSFIGQPLWDGNTYETGALARQNSHPLIAQIIKKYGAGLLARHVARLVELAKIPLEIEQCCDVLETTQHNEITTQNIGMVETARGRLIHSVCMDGDIVGDYKILAPTEWNFHKNGIAAQALQTLMGHETEESLVAQATMVVEAIDPCVNFEVRVV